MDSKVTIYGRRSRTRGREKIRRSSQKGETRGKGSGGRNSNKKGRKMIILEKWGGGGKGGGGFASKRTLPNKVA